MTPNTHPRLIAFYLPQYHPIPENDEWWGKGFTEWTNVAKAKPLFKGHYQPHLPADLGFYDLRVPEVRQAQADMAREAGIEGFCYWHYWFAGKQLLERPFNEVLASGKPDFPFCLAWANESWSGIWHGAPDKILIEQTYPGDEDHEKHFHSLLPAFSDPRYLTIDEKPIFVIYRPKQLPDCKQFTELWQNLAIKTGLKGIFFIGIGSGTDWDPDEIGVDAMTTTEFSKIRNSQKARSLASRLRKIPGRYHIRYFYKHILHKPLDVYEYKDAIQVLDGNLRFEYFPTIIPNWDNTPRSRENGFVLLNSTPEKFANFLDQAIARVSKYEDDHKIIFIKSWNEWAEGNHLEPDMKFGKGYLEIIKESVTRK